MPWPPSTTWWRRWPPSRDQGVRAVPDPTRRFSDRVEEYVRWRPRYPPALVELLKAECGLRPEHVVADVGSGTGFLTEVFLRNGNRVFAIEPNAAMASAAVATLSGDPGYVPIEGRAEDTGLPDASVDLVAAGQAFHWFDPAGARAEFRRILRPGGGPVVLVWNLRRNDASLFLTEYEAFLHEWGTDYAEVSARTASAQVLAAFFAPFEVRRHTLYNEQAFDREGLRGRVLSSSYMPAAGHARHAPMLEALDALFSRHARDGKVAFVYDTDVYWAPMS